MYWIGENGGDTAEEVVAFIKKHKLLDLEEDEEDEEDKQCSDCEYTLSKSAFDSGKGRIMFDDLEEGKFRCGVCDDRVSDPMGMFPDDEKEDSENDSSISLLLGCCVCSFPKFYIDDGIQKCSRCGFRDHYKNGVVADYPTDEE